MAGKLGKFQMVGFQHWKGLAKENHLGSHLSVSSTEGYKPNGATVGLLQRKDT